MSKNYYDLVEEIMSKKNQIKEYIVEYKSKNNIKKERGMLYISYHSVHYYYYVIVMI